MKFKSDDFDAELKNMDLLMSKTEKLFTALTPEERFKNEVEGLPVDKIQTTIPYQRRQNLANNLCNKLKLRN